MSPLSHFIAYHRIPSLPLINLERTEDKNPANRAAQPLLYNMSGHINIKRRCGCTACFYRYLLTGDSIIIDGRVGIEHEAPALAKEISENAQTLELLWLAYGKVALSRWADCPAKARRRILKSAWPDMPLEHRPDLQRYESLNKSGRSTSNQVAQNMMLHPHMNIEDLGYSDNLIRMLESRAMNSPESFFMLDLLLANVSPYTHQDDIASLKNFSMLLSGGKECKTYGVLQHDNKFKAEQLKVDPCSGLFGLRIQASLYSILRKATESLLKSLNLSTDYLKTAPRSNIENILQDERFTSLQTAAARAPYHKPSKIDWLLLDDLVASRLTCAQSHLKHARENPPYLAGWYRQWADHLNLQPNEMDQVVNYACAQDHRALWQWHKIGQMLKALKESLPRENRVTYVNFQQLKGFVVSSAKRAITTLALAVANAPTFAAHVEAKTKPHARGHDNILDLRLRRDASDASRRLFRLFHLLCSNESIVFGECAIVREIDRLLTEDEDAAALMTPLLSERFDNLAGLIEVQAQLALWEPHASLAVKEMSASYGFREAVLASSNALLEEFKKIESQMHRYINARRFNPHSKEMECPLEPPATEEIERRQRKACGILEIWWSDLYASLGWTRNRARNGLLDEPWNELVLACAPDKLNYPYRWAVPVSPAITEERDSSESPPEETEHEEESAEDDASQATDTEDTASDLTEPLAESLETKVSQYHIAWKEEGAENDGSRGSTFYATRVQISETPWDTIEAETPHGGISPASTEPFSTEPPKAQLLPDGLAAPVCQPSLSDQNTPKVNMAELKPETNADMSLV